MPDTCQITVPGSGDVKINNTKCSFSGNSQYNKKQTNKTKIDPDTAWSVLLDGYGGNVIRINKQVKKKE